MTNIEIENQCCMFPFKTAEISEDGTVYACCALHFGGYFFGNIYEQPFEQIWNGEKAQIFRRQFIDDDYKYCNFYRCTRKTLSSVIKPDIKTPPPEIFQLYINKNNAGYNKDYENAVLPLLKTAKLISIKTPDEFFLNNNARTLALKIVKLYPDAKFALYSNGINCGEKSLKKYGVWNRIIQMIISMNSISKEDKNFQKIVKNIKFLSALRKENKIRSFIIRFSISSSNYKEMGAMKKFAQENNAKASFLTSSGYITNYD